MKLILTICQIRIDSTSTGVCVAVNNYNKATQYLNLWWPKGEPLPAIGDVYRLKLDERSKDKK